MTNTTVPADLITTKAITALEACQTLRKFHDTTQALIKDQQLGLDFAPKRNNAFALPVALLVCNIADGVRDDLDQEAIRSFADAYKAGSPVDPLGVVPEKGKLRVVIGITRYVGLMLAISEGCSIKQVWVNELDGNPANVRLRQLMSNRQVALKPVETANGYRSLMDEHGMSVAEIAKQLHVKESHVRTMLEFAKVPEKVKDMVVAGQVSVTKAVVEARKCKRGGTDTVVHMKGQLEKAREKGSNKITAKSTSTPSALYSRKDLDASVPALLTLADALEKALPFMGAAPDEVTLELKLGGDLQGLLEALANLRSAHRSAHGEAQPLAVAN